MKIFISLILLEAFMLNGMAAQTMPEVNNSKKNSISFELYQPIQTPMREFYNEEWITGPPQDPKGNYSRTQSSNSYGICYERITKNNIVIRPRIGMTFRKINEGNDSTISDGNPSDISDNYTYNQKHLNLFIGVAKKNIISRTISIDFGLDLASISYFEGKSKYNYVSNVIDPGTGDHYEQIITVNSVIGKAYAYGFGPYLKTEVVLYKNLIASFEMQAFYLNTIAKDKSTKIEISDTYQNSVNIEHVEIPNEIHYNVSQWNWSKVSPLIRIGYRF